MLPGAQPRSMSVRTAGLQFLSPRDAWLSIAEVGTGKARSYTGKAAFHACDFNQHPFIATTSASQPGGPDRHQIAVGNGRNATSCRRSQQELKSTFTANTADSARTISQKESGAGKTRAASAFIPSIDQDSIPTSANVTSLSEPTKHSFSGLPSSVPAPSSRRPRGGR